MKKHNLFTFKNTPIAITVLMLLGFVQSSKLEANQHQSLIADFSSYTFKAEHFSTCQPADPDTTRKMLCTPEPGLSLGIASVKNLRDLGGYKTKDGSTVVRGLVYRSNQLAPISEDDMKEIAGLGLKNEYDLRTEAERTSFPDQLPPGVNNVWLDVLKDDIGAGPATIFASLQNPEKANKSWGGGKMAAAFEKTYRECITLPSAKAAYRELFLSLSDQNKLPALFHCTTGKDRTGWAAAALLTLLEVPEETVMEDYLRSNDYILPLYQKAIDDFVALGVEPSIPEAMFALREAYLEAAFDEMEKQYGSIGNYFSEGLGIDAVTQKRLRDLLLEKR